MVILYFIHDKCKFFRAYVGKCSRPRSSVNKSGVQCLISSTIYLLCGYSQARVIFMFIARCHVHTLANLTRRFSSLLDLLHMSIREHLKVKLKE